MSKAYGQGLIDDERRGDQFDVALRHMGEKRFGFRTIGFVEEEFRKHRGVHNDHST